MFPPYQEFRIYSLNEFVVHNSNFGNKNTIQDWYQHE